MPNITTSQIRANAGGVSTTVKISMNDFGVATSAGQAGLTLDTTAGPVTIYVPHMSQGAYRVTYTGSLSGQIEPGLRTTIAAGNTITLLPQIRDGALAGSQVGTVDVALFA